jgi:hypothetical protein
LQSVFPDSSRFLLDPNKPSAIKSRRIHHMSSAEAQLTFVRSARKQSGAGRKFIIGGNWKCATDSAKVNEITEMLNGIKVIPPTVEVFVAPPNPFLGLLARNLRDDIAVSSQDCGEYHIEE